MRDLKCKNGGDGFTLTKKHKKIRFSKRSIKKLHHFPSSMQSDGIKIRERRIVPFCFLLAKRCLIYSFILLVLFSILLAILLKVGISGNMLAQKMEAALQGKLINVAETKIDDASLSFDESYHLALEAHNVGLTNVKGGVEIDKIGILRLGLATAPLLKGNIKVAQFEIADSSIHMPASNDGNFLDKLPQDTSGNIDFDTISFALFKAFDGVFSALKSQETHLVVIRNVSVHFGSEAVQKTFYIDELSLQYENNYILATGSLTWKDQKIALEATVNTSASGAADSFVISMKDFPFHLGADDNVARIFADGRPNNNYFRSRGKVNLALQGALTTNNTTQLELTLGLGETGTDIAQDNDIATSGEINLAYKSGDGQIAILPSELILGSLYLPLKGGVQSISMSGEQGVYAFNLVMNDGAVKPDDVKAARLDFNGEIKGRFFAKRAFVDFSQLLLETKNGKIDGRGSLQFGVGSPQTLLEFSMPQMPSDEIKQIWPINLSPGARRWVVSHVAGGEVKNANLKINFPQGIFVPGGVPPVLSDNELVLEGEFERVSTLLVGDLPPLRQGAGRVVIKGTTTEIFMDSAISYIDNKEDQIELSEGYFVIPWRPNIKVFANASARFKGKVSDVVRLVSLDPINAKDKVPFKAEEVSGDVSGLLKIRFPLMPRPDKSLINWSSELLFDKLSLLSPLDGNILITQAKGTAKLNKSDITIIADANLNGIPANINLYRPMGPSDIIPSETIRIQLTDDIRKKLMPGLNSIVSGTVALEIGAPIEGARPVKADVSNAEIRLPWVSWTKGKGIAGEVQFSFKNGGGNVKTIELHNFSLKGNSFMIAGNILIQNGALQSADLSRANLNRGDSLGLTLRKTNNGYRIVANGKKLDARALVKMVSGSQNQGQAKSNDSLDLVADIDSLSGFYDETLSNVKLKMVRRGSSSEDVIFNALTGDNKSITAKITRNNNSRDIAVNAANAGGLLRFMDFYDKVRGGILQLSLKSGTDGTLKGPVNVQDFQIVNEPRLASLVSSTPHSGGKSLNQAVDGKLDVSVAVIETASAQIGKGDSFLVIDGGVIRGQTIGATFQGIVYDASGNMSMTGTFMPAYGINRVFGDVPVLGTILGNGRDRGLIGITFKIDGKAREPKVTVNPISAIAPGIFRQIFEYKQQ